MAHPNSFEISLEEFDEPLSESFPETTENIQKKGKSPAQSTEAISQARHEQLVDRVKVEKMRKGLKTPGGAPVMISFDHIQRHFIGSETLGASINGWDHAEDMLLDPEVWGFVEESVQKLSTKIVPGEAVTFTHDFIRDIGHESIVRLADLPPDAKVFLTTREGYYVNMVENTPPPTNRLHMMFMRDKRNPAQFLLHSAWSGTVTSPGGSLKNPDWKDFAFYAGNR